MRPPGLSSLEDSLDRFISPDEWRRPEPVRGGTHPAAAIVITVGFLVTVMSFDRRSLLSPLPLMAYPAIMLAGSGFPLRRLARSLMIVEPLIIGIGIMQPILDRRPVDLAGFQVAEGWLVLASLALKCTLAAAAALLLAAGQGMERLAIGLRTLGVPRLFVLQLILTHRYLRVILEEAGRLALAAFLRAGGGKPRLSEWGAMAGGLLIRSCDRAERIHLAMRLRGFAGEWRPGPGISGSGLDLARIVGWLAFFALVRIHNLPELLGKTLLGAIPA